MLDYLFPGRSKKNNSARRAQRNSEPLLLVVWDLASFAKHFDGLDKNHDSVDQLGAPGEYFGASYFGGQFFGGGFFGGTPCIKFTGNAVNHFGNSLSVLDVAERVYAYWQKHC